MDTKVRLAVLGDLDRMVELSASKRDAYEKFQPVFWKKAKDADAKQKAFFEAQLGNQRMVLLVSEGKDGVDGFLIAAFTPAPPVYDPGGLTCLVDDFCVSSPKDWLTTGAALLEEVRKAAARRGVVQMVLMCGQKDGPKMDFLAGIGFETATEIKVKTIRDKE